MKYVMYATHDCTQHNTYVNTYVDHIIHIEILWRVKTVFIASGSPVDINIVERQESTGLAPNSLPSQ